MSKEGMKTLFGYIWVGWLNIILFQWLFFRLAYAVDENGNRVRWGMVKWGWPLSGWGNEFRYVGRGK